MSSDVRSDATGDVRPLRWEYAPQGARDDAEPSFERAGVLRWALAVVLALVLLGVLGGWLWSLLADPPGYTVSASGASMGEAEAGKRFGVEVGYAGIGAGLGLTAGLVAGLVLARYGWVLVVSLVVGGLLAAGVSWAVGGWLGPPDPADMLRSASVGDVVPSRLTIDTPGLFLVWPVAALAGLLSAVGLVGRTTEQQGNGAARAPAGSSTQT
ncbi:MAG: hypothetical protein AVDCRST_MAG29-2581 [uncultured Nocardioidaceae bacterium]|uniref:DUF2567 domain-containing protein n=1 Tax=uncultured Nocardioidaceae bacterium TaxID=253824 RepID=A0A6J4MDT8_9ACTN|nr:MAG: hypothetical protein AVDCRST_MAG29-2581 [uncultured Nocardioidaceae bacterium]